MIKQGDIYLVNLNPTKGHEQSGTRPVLVLQKDILNQYLNTVTISPITSNLNSKGKMTTYFLPKKKSGLHQDSVALLFQIRTIDKSRLIKKVGHLKEDDFMILRVKLSQLFW